MEWQFLRVNRNDATASERSDNASFCKSYWHAAQNFSIQCNLFNAIEMDFGISRIVYEAS